MTQPAEKTILQIQQELESIMPHKWRLMSKKFDMEYVAYVDARQVADKLNAVMGLNNWCDKYYEVAGKVYCALSLRIKGEWITRSDCGSESNIEGEKGQASDAFKRSAVKFGIGRFLYDFPIVKFKKQVNGNFVNPATKDGQKIWPKDLHEMCEKSAHFIMSRNK